MSTLQSLGWPLACLALNAPSQNPSQPAISAAHTYRLFSFLKSVSTRRRLQKLNYNIFWSCLQVVAFSKKLPTFETALPTLACWPLLLVSLRSFSRVMHYNMFLKSPASCAFLAKLPASQHSGLAANFSTPPPFKLICSFSRETRLCTCFYDCVKCPISFEARNGSSFVAFLSWVSFYSL